MIDIYDEEGYIQRVLEQGLSERWKRDASLLIKYYKTKYYSGEQPEWTKKWVKETILKKCEDGVKGFNKITRKGEINSLVDSVWKDWKIDKEHPEKSSKLRKVKQIEFSREVLDWFLGLEENVVLTPTEREKLQERHTMKISEHPVKFLRIKYLFTLFVWSKIQESYLENYNVHYLKKFTQKFRRDGDLGQSFSFMYEKELMSDLGFIEVNRASGIKAVFMELPVFQIPVTDKNRILLGGDDLYNCGYWLKKQRNGYFICQNCGKEIAFDKKNGKDNYKMKYCSECAELLKNHVQEEYFCCDCGKPIEHNSLTKRIKKRCASCQYERDKKMTALRMRKMREKQAMLRSKAIDPNLDKPNKNMG